MPPTKNTKTTAKGPSREKFIELLEPRVSSVLDRLDVVKKLARPRDYAYTSDDIDAIEAAVMAKVTEVLGAFRSPQAVTHEPTFRLPGTSGAAHAESA